MMVQNKWNLKLYEVIERDNKIVTLKREDGSVFRVTLSEFYSTYKKLNN